MIPALAPSLMASVPAGASVAATTAATIAGPASLFSMSNLALASMGLGIGGTVSSFMAERQAGRTESDILKYNAEVLKLQGAAKIRQGISESQIMRERARRLLSTQKAKIAGFGGEISGSKLVVLAEDYGLAQLDIDQMMRNAELEAGGLTSEAGLMTQKARLAKKTGNVRAWTSLMGGGSQLLSQYAMYRYIPKIQG